MALTTQDRIGIRLALGLAEVPQLTIVIVYDKKKRNPVPFVSLCCAGKNMYFKAIRVLAKV